MSMHMNHEIWKFRFYHVCMCVGVGVGGVGLGMCVWRGVHVCVPVDPII